MIPFNGFHIELTNICTLKCAACSRTTFINKFGSKKFKTHSLVLEELKYFLQHTDLAGKVVSLCGNYGDPIYHKDFNLFVKYFKQQKAIVKIVTNGSYKTKEFWEELTNLLTQQDKIVFSIDGTPENFTTYRVNADWDSIETGLKVVGSSTVDSEWKYIPFNYNENDIDEVKLLSASYGIKKFNIHSSDRWDTPTSHLKPILFTGSREHAHVNWKDDPSQIEIAPECNAGKAHYITADGYYTPCCYVHDWRFYYKSEFYKNREKYKISNNTFKDILEQTTEFYNTITTVKPNYCTFNCPKT